jgi:hypothetical protein
VFNGLVTIHDRICVPHAAREGVVPSTAEIAADLHAVK